MLTTNLLQDESGYHKQSFTEVFRKPHLRKYTLIFTINL